MKKIIKKIYSNLLDQNKQDDYNIDKSQDSQPYDKTDLEKLKDLNIC